jgi:UDP-glucuronate decarboxylase
MIEAFVRLMDSPDDVIGPVNVGNPGEFTIQELAEKVIDLTASGSELVFKPLPSDDPTRRCPDISVAKDKLGWEPTVKLEEGLRKTISYFDTLLGEKPD